MNGNANTPPPTERRLLDRVRDAIRRLHYSRRTEETYIHWIKRFIFFSNRRHPKEMGAAEVTAFLNHLARERSVAAATQNQALSALLFMYKEVLAEPLPWLDELDRATCDGVEELRRRARRRAPLKTNLLMADAF